MKKKTLLLLFFGLFALPFFGQSQAEPEDVAVVLDEFQDFFYESLLQKGIENYDKAILALEKCLLRQPNNASLHFELGKNYFKLNQYENAYQSFEKAAQIDPTNRWFWVGMYDVSFQTKAYQRAMLAVQKLIPFDEQYKNDLIPLYLIDNQSEKALALIQEMNAKFGKSQERIQFKNQILLASKNENAEADFKTDLNPENASKAIQSMQRILADNQTMPTVKQRVLNEFLLFVATNPQYETELDKVVLCFENDKQAAVAQEIAAFYQNKKQTDKAVYYYELALNKGGDLLQTNRLLLQAYARALQFEKLAQKTSAVIALYPAEPQFYFYSGLANNQMGQFKKAKEDLELGLEYVLDNLDLEISFHLQLAEAYNGLGDFKKKDLFFAKANQLALKKEIQK